MSESYYAPGRERAENVQVLFTRIARRYDLINDLQSFGLHRYWKAQLVRLSQVRQDQRVLDVCTGTGDVARAFARTGARVVGFDFAQAMLNQAILKPDPPVQLVRGDALRLPFKSETFDIVTISYGLRNLADFEAGIGELLRVTKPGGRVLILDFGKPDNPLWRSLYFAYLRIAVPLFGLVFCRDAAAYAYILESLHQYPAQRGVDHALRNHNCRNVCIHSFLGGAMSINYAER